jgi:hypothetical protein
LVLSTRTLNERRLAGAGFDRCSGGGERLVSGEWLAMGAVAALAAVSSARGSTNVSGSYMNDLLRRIVRTYKRFPRVSLSGKKTPDLQTQWESHWVSGGINDDDSLDIMHPGLSFSHEDHNEPVRVEVWTSWHRPERHHLGAQALVGPAPHWGAAHLTIWVYYEVFSDRELDAVKSIPLSGANKLTGDLTHDTAVYWSLLAPVLRDLEKATHPLPVECPLDSQTLQTAIRDQADAYARILAAHGFAQ